MREVQKMFTSGLTDTIDVIEIGKADSSFGTVIPTESTVQETLLCRFTKMKAELLTTYAGKDSEKMWQVITTNTDKFVRGRVYKVDDGTFKYDVLFAQRQRDASGEYHHVTLHVEQI